MAQVMVNFRMDESVKKSMELACKEMGLSMTAAFTIFATKVGREKRIPFEITAERSGPEAAPGPRPGIPMAEDPLVQRQERLETLCAEIRRSLTSIHTAIPSSITGLTMERIRLLCGGELKDKAVSAAARPLFSGRNAIALREKDLGVLDQYLDGLADIAEEIWSVERVLVPAMKAWAGGGGDAFAAYEQRLSEVSRAFDGLRPVMDRFLSSAAPGRGEARALQSRLRQAAAGLETDYVLAALEDLETLVLRHYDALDSSAKARLESHYFQTLELTLQELGRAEQSGEDPGGKAALCLRAAGVLSQALASGGQARREKDGRGLEAEVSALERLAAMRGDIPGPPGPEV